MYVTVLISSDLVCSILAPVPEWERRLNSTWIDAHEVKICNRSEDEEKLWKRKFISWFRKYDQHERSTWLKWLKVIKSYVLLSPSYKIVGFTSHLVEFLQSNIRSPKYLEGVISILNINYFKIIKSIRFWSAVFTRFTSFLLSFACRQRVCSNGCLFHVSCVFTSRVRRLN